MLWAALGAGAGFIAGFALSEWVGGVSGSRVRRAAQRLAEASPVRLTPAASVRAVEAALLAEPRLAGLGIEPTAVARGVVELHGWVPDRATRALAGRVARETAGIERVINSLLVRGEDDQALSDSRSASNQGT